MTTPGATGASATTGTGHVIETRGLRKTFGATLALDSLDLSVRAGEVHGFLGPNGSGKSTTLRILLGLLRSDAGIARLFGQDPWRNAVALHHRLAYVPGDVTLWPNLTGGEVIDLLTSLRGSADAGRRAELIERFELDPTKKGRSYSKGNRQKVALVAALAGDAELLVLDEPTSGLDPLMEQVFQDELVRVRDQGRTVLLSSHILSEVEKACDTVSIVRGGRVVDHGTLAELQHLTRIHVRATLAAPPDPTAVRAWPGVAGATLTGERLDVDVDTDHVGAVVASLQPHGIQALTCQPPTLEELFLARYRDESGATAGGAGS